VALRATAKGLISRGFGHVLLHKTVSYFAVQHRPTGGRDKKISLANFLIRSTLALRAEFVRY